MSRGEPQSCFCQLAKDGRRRRRGGNPSACPPVGQGGSLAASATTTLQPGAALAGSADDPARETFGAEAGAARVRDAPSAATTRRAPRKKGWRVPRRPPSRVSARGCPAGLGGGFSGGCCSPRGGPEAGAGGAAIWSFPPAKRRRFRRGGGCERRCWKWLPTEKAPLLSRAAGGRGQAWC